MNRLHIFIETAQHDEKKKGARYTNEYYFIEQYLHEKYSNLSSEYLKPLREFIRSHINMNNK